jgi:hypothetical protein
MYKRTGSKKLPMVGPTDYDTIASCYAAGVDERPWNALYERCAHVGGYALSVGRWLVRRHTFGLGLLVARLLHVIEAWSQYRIPTVQLKKGVAKMIEISGRELKSTVHFPNSGQSRRLWSLTEIEESFDRLIDQFVLTVHRNLREKFLCCGRSPKKRCIKRTVKLPPSPAIAEVALLRIPDVHLLSILRAL